LSPDSIERQCTTSLQRLGLSSFDLYYLHMPDLSVPVINSLRSVAKLHEQGRIKRFGLSNYTAWQVAEIVEICRAEGWLAPCVYQGMYNALTRDVERELLPCLANYDMAFYVYNPLAGGLLSGKHTSINALPDSGRFASFTAYQERYWKPAYFDVINGIADSCRAEGIEPAAAALRWLVHHSALASGSPTQAASQAATPARTGKSTAGTQVGHGIIIGASTFSHFEKNLAAVAGPALPASLADAFDNGWLEVRPACIKYFRP
jgi:aflatoxin B1 aldehyde reductase